MVRWAEAAEIRREGLIESGCQQRQGLARRAGTHVESTCVARRLDNLMTIGRSSMSLSSFSSAVSRATSSKIERSDKASRCNVSIIASLRKGNHSA